MIVLLTDFGTTDGYVAAMKGVIASEAPGVPVVDAAHDVAPQDIAAGAWALANYLPYYPAGTIHVAVIDPGVGTKRSLVLVEAEGQQVLAPDNGLLSIWLGSVSSHQVRALRPGWGRPGGTSQTFHGRDILAYAAAKLAAGGLPDDALIPLDDPLVQLPESRTHIKEDHILGRIVHIDRFGNAISGITRDQIQSVKGRRRAIILPYGDKIPLKTTYGDVPPGATLALLNSSDRLEVAIHAGNASVTHGLIRGSEVKVMFS
jgi:S-adenosylmethionine hydrolase